MNSLLSILNLLTHGLEQIVALILAISVGSIVLIALVIALITIDIRQVNMGIKTLANKLAIF